MINLIVNADDFGLTESISDGIIKTYKEGIVRSVSVIVNTPSFEYSVRLLKENPELDAGVHLTFVGEDMPVTGEVRGLTSKEGFYLNWKRVLFNRFLNPIDKKGLEREARAQIEKLLEAGIAPSHIDSHQHLHLLPEISNIVLELAKEYGIKFVRCPRSEQKWYFFVNHLSKKLKKELLQTGFPPPPEFLGFNCSGKLTTGQLKNIMDRLSSGTYELMVHPGFENDALRQRYRWGYKWEEEMMTLVSKETRSMLERKKINLISFKDLTRI